MTNDYRVRHLHRSQPCPRPLVAGGIPHPQTTIKVFARLKLGTVHYAI